MYDLFSKQNAARNAKANNPYYFLVLEGVGVTYYRGPIEEIQIHLVDDRDLKPIFNQSTRAFPGGPRQTASALPVLEPKVGDSIRIQNSQSGEYSRPLRIDAIFRTPHIGEKISSDVFVDLELDGTLSNLTDITSIGEFHYSTGIARGLILTAMLSSSFIIDYATAMNLSGFETSEQFNRWLNDFIDAGLVAEVDSKTIELCGSLIYMVMHAINRRKIMAGPIFTF